MKVARMRGGGCFIVKLRVFANNNPAGALYRIHSIHHTSKDSHEFCEIHGRKLRDEQRHSKVKTNTSGYV